MSSDAIRLELPLDRARLAELHAGDACKLTGPLYTLRDAGHIRLLDELDRAHEPRSVLQEYGLEGQTIFYAGPTPPAAGRPFGAIGPTTSSRMDFAAPRLYDLGIVATVGKGVRSQAVKDACVRNGSMYFVTVGGAAAYLAKCVTASETLAYDDLGTEALRRIEVADFPVFAGIDVQGNDIYDMV
ncbi:MAG: fumarate hydratase C-terminal domain-containing protein [Eggerthellaceae bacterium]|nr:fumarate hydratase C-terminal domain-containing protein [Eggerthellaceae bacterium]